MNKVNQLTLASIAGGAARELFQDELRAVVTNILDPNTEPRAKRELTVTVTITPDPEDRTMGRVNVRVTSKLGKRRPAATLVFFGLQEGEPVALESDPRQPKLFEEERAADLPSEAEVASADFYRGGPRPVPDRESIGGREAS